MTEPTTAELVAFLREDWLRDEASCQGITNGDRCVAWLEFAASRLEVLSRLAEVDARADAVGGVLDARQKRAEHLYDLLREARENVRKRLEPDSPPENRALYGTLNAALHSLSGDPFDLHIRAALAAGRLREKPDDTHAALVRRHQDLHAEVLEALNRLVSACDVAQEHVALPGMLVAEIERANAALLAGRIWAMAEEE